MMFKYLLFACLALAVTAETAKPCDENVCKLPNCRCSSTDVPGGLNASEIPQMVLLTFDDALTKLNYDNYFVKAFTDRVNPDGCPIGVTYFIAHEYSDYTLVHQLHSIGAEIALHSITHDTVANYWMNLTSEGYISEFGGERELVAKFANIDIETITGMRVPFLQLAGDNSFLAIPATALTYDCSWPTQSYTDPGLWPYTLDYASSQDCPIGPCPTSSIPGAWVIPMVVWKDTTGVICSMVDACVNIPKDEDGVLEWVKQQFHLHYDGNRAPFGFYVHAAWFTVNEMHFNVYLRFLDYLQSLNDVYIVGAARALQWVRNPSTLDNLSQSWPECQPAHPNRCTSPSACRLMKGEEERYMQSCAPCPSTYPWLGNPYGL